MRATPAAPDGPSLTLDGRDIIIYNGKDTITLDLCTLKANIVKLEACRSEHRWTIPMMQDLRP